MIYYKTNGQERIALDNHWFFCAAIVGITQYL